MQHYKNKALEVSYGLGCGYIRQIIFDDDYCPFLTLDVYNPCSFQILRELGRQTLKLTTPANSPWPVSHTSPLEESLLGDEEDE